MTKFYSFFSTRRITSCPVVGHPVRVPTFLPIRIESIARSIRSADSRAHASARVARLYTQASFVSR